MVVNQHCTNLVDLQAQYFCGLSLPNRYLDFILVFTALLIA
jgi:hypothetical protein